VEAGIKRPVAIGIGVALFAGIATVAVLLLTPRNSSELPAGLTPVMDSSTIAQFVQLTHLGILTSTNYLGHRVYTVIAKLKNTSDKPIRRIDVKLVFFDYDKKLIRQEGHTAFDLNHTPLQPSAEYPMEIAFEDPPSNWNYHVPDTQVVMVAY
jgi:hypothetical protein